jgi:SAM-dependent methyltransferase
MEGLWLGSWVRFILGTRLGPYVPTPQHVVTRMLSLASVQAADCVHDVGCGDGRMLLAAAQQHGARGVGYELDARLAAAATQAVLDAGLQHRIDVRRADAREACFDGADVDGHRRRRSRSSRDGHGSHGQTGRREIRRRDCRSRAAHGGAGSSGRRNGEGDHDCVAGGVRAAAP